MKKHAAICRDSTLDSRPSMKRPRMTIVPSPRLVTPTGSVVSSTIDFSEVDRPAQAAEMQVTHASVRRL